MGEGRSKESTWSPLSPFAIDEEAHTNIISPVGASGNQYEHLRRNILINRFGISPLSMVRTSGWSFMYASISRR